ncbi:MAG: SPOR domain-containing protein [Candidatus Omnitrophica bacterium]|nr:SPOR domain-containing protein [Candidatus Omnitrophota bacterium]
MVQGELFREEGSSYSFNAIDSGKGKSFLRRHQITLTLDQLLLASLACVVAVALVYCFGVERGKRTMEKQVQNLVSERSETIPASETPIAVRGRQMEAVLMVNQEPAAESKVMTPQAETSQEVTIHVPKQTQGFPLVDLSNSERYTVQLVTYVDEKMASREIDRLKAKGHNGFVIPSGRYFQVCANYFESTRQAKDFLKQLRETGRYPDAYIRPVVR